MKHWDTEIDALGLLCPLPVLRLRKRLAGLATGDIAKLLTDDPAAIIDVPHFCAETGHRYLGSEALPSNRQAHFVQKA